MSRMYVVVRNDLAPGLQIAQACHAAYAFGLYSPDESRENLVVLSTDKASLETLVAAVAQRDGGHVPFYEPDLGDELTACAFDETSRKALSCLPLALRDSTKLSDLTV